MSGQMPERYDLRSDYTGNIYNIDRMQCCVLIEFVMYCKDSASVPGIIHTLRDEYQMNQTLRYTRNVGYKLQSNVPQAVRWGVC